MRRICSECDKDLPETNAAPGDPDVKYVDDLHRGCIEPATPKNITLRVATVTEVVERNGQLVLVKRG